jgi:hypothetical protein
MRHFFERFLVEQNKELLGLLQEVKKEFYIRKSAFSRVTTNYSNGLISHCVHGACSQFVDKLLQYDFCIRCTNSFTLMISFVFSSWIINAFHNVMLRTYINCCVELFKKKRMLSIHLGLEKYNWVCPVTSACHSNSTMDQYLVIHGNVSQVSRVQPSLDHQYSRSAKGGVNEIFSKPINKGNLYTCLFFRKVQRNQ